MKIEGGASYLFASQHANHAARTDSEASAFNALLTKQTESTAAANATASVEFEQRDFTSMTRQELQDWVRERSRSGEMAVDESSAFLGWMVDVRIDDHGRAISHDGDYTTRFNFFDLVSGNRDFYLQRGDQAAAARIQAALDHMKRS